MPRLFTTRAAALRYITTLTLLCLSITPVARAAAGDCSSSGGSLACHLTGVLHWLDAAAAVLAIVLLVVIAIAIHVYRKNRAGRSEPR